MNKNIKNPQSLEDVQTGIFKQIKRDKKLIQLIFL